MEPTFKSDPEAQRARGKKIAAGYNTSEFKAPNLDGYARGGEVKGKSKGKGRSRKPPAPPVAAAPPMDAPLMAGPPGLPPEMGPPPDEQMGPGAGPGGGGAPFKRGGKAKAYATGGKVAGDGDADDMPPAKGGDGAGKGIALLIAMKKAGKK